MIDHDSRIIRQYHNSPYMYYSFMYRTDPSFPLTVKVEKLLSTISCYWKPTAYFTFFTNQHTMCPAQWGPDFVGLWATRRPSNDVPATFCCDKDSDSSPLGARTFNLPPPQFTDQWSRFLGLTRSLQRRWKFQEFSGYFSVLKWRQN